ncbi:hypothetical protein A2334_03225 [Candidatus Roizmanbacteria bacterium RIFOXYB2_FULL_38_10]|uniref:Peptidase C45 hydrolase domain-containing protein n=1 Tax=Candidatus Roizmanbacteria bacterium RIFOXYD1_FULL_38_12 TaxID=1802093 RepID=A0A1F7L139_9BACT|nr:MAG: hypothetical protein A3K47_03625 [Candidatus Roizmanbacteria bacterium RIFOXYA2_FULL_38_14]OGK63852.1 MAG: hypothetical protein A3K27_03625 [Candidatus Roizmanbacteria bacterium RIFOXYA1_FULL_37_12]OGK65698.1 MAG: hypothetical protein A3K38_03625 [Candidatus Roizmanbacteria bacterium RIFOXYB1_FULL_40_23]OGK67416.1 MAG: hypothetical protein A2334_03225 [Candidatus Roizmanbacteria bacterium RIFOXYB2_FULL_38_10]OGK70103.1 MAG: hypothetical protein A3K21_03630 [Candidatus Roizmanbacteria ba
MKIIEVHAKDHYEAGYLLGQLTAKMQTAYIKAFHLPAPWDILIKKSLPFLDVTKKVFPQYIDEINGLANGAKIPFEKLWVFHCIDEVMEKQHIERCTSIFLKQENGSGYIVGHNEDWDVWTGEYFFILKRTLDNKTVVELGLAGLISGGTICINSSGMIQAINSLYHTDYQIGIPKQIVARWLSSRESLEEVKEEFPKLRRAAGYCYNMSKKTKVLSIESSARRYEFFETNKNYVHTNHYIGTLKEVEKQYKEEMQSLGRYQHIRSVLSQVHTVNVLKDLLLYTTNDDSSVYRTKETSTVASVIFDVPKKIMYAAQENKGLNTLWQQINLDFIT